MDSAGNLPTEEWDLEIRIVETSIKQFMPLSGLAISGFAVGLIAVIMAISAGFGSRWGWWHFGIGFLILRYAVYVATAAAVISLLGMVVSRPGNGKRGMWLAFLGLLVSSPVIGVPISWMSTARSVPAIHDITTDTVDPPQFVAIIPLRTNASNPTYYGGTVIAAKQRAAYPDIQPLIVKSVPSIAFKNALKVAKQLDWKIVATDPNLGRIEASDTTFWFGFTDDIVIRVLSMGSGSKVDIRSESRVGLSDVGTNAARIRRFIKAFKKLKLQDASTNPADKVD